MIIFAALALAQASPPPPPPIITALTDEGRFCDRMRALSEELAAELPMMVDKASRTDGMSVSCARRAVTWDSFLFADASAMREGWQNRKQAQFSRVVCDNPDFARMARAGWRFIQNVTLQSGERFSLDADCVPG